MKKSNQGNKQKAVLNPIAVDTEGLQAIVGCGYPTAVKIGEEAGAKIIVGKRVLWNVQKVSEYLYSISI